MDRALAASTGSAVATSIAVVAGTDLLSKAAVAVALPLHAGVLVDRAGWIRVLHVENCGGAGGLIPRFPLAAYVGAVLWAVWKARDGLPGTAAIAGGAVGNIASLATALGPTGLRLTAAPGLFGLPFPTGCVTDWIQLGAPLLGSTPGVGAPVFNLADLFLIGGAVVVSRGEPDSALGWAGVLARGVLVLVGAGVVLHLIHRALLALLGR
jgi:lipoprotein signal peptidase